MVALNQPDKLAGFARTTSDTESVRIPDFFSGFSVDFDQAQRTKSRKKD
jgi:hypothetical protein